MADEDQGPFRPYAGGPDPRLIREMRRLLTRCQELEAEVARLLEERERERKRK